MMAWMARKEVWFANRPAHRALLAGIVVIAVSIAGFLAFHQIKIARERALETKMTEDRFAVYRAVLADWVKDDRGPVFLADRTEPLDVSGYGVRDCWRGLELEEVLPAYHYHFRPEDLSQLGAKGIVLVDSERYERNFSEFVERTKTMGMRDAPKPASRDQMDELIGTAIDHGLLSVSEIHFDKSHTHAIVSYDFYCLGLCGGGQTIALEKANGVWKRKAYCTGWAS
jgi:hypothetical protein